MNTVVTKTFMGPEARIYHPGEVINSTGWRLEQKLIDQRYLRLATDEDKVPLRAGKGRI